MSRIPVPCRQRLFQVRAVSIYFLMVGMEQVLYAIEQASRIRRNGHHLAILRAQEALLGLSIPESILLRAGAVIR